MNVVRNSVVRTVETTVGASKTAAKTVKKLISDSGSDEDKRWRELQRLEKKRRAILKRAEEPFWKSLFHWDGTVLSHLKTDSVLWLSMGIYIATRVLAREGMPDFVSDLDGGRMGIVGGFVTFFLVFYANQSHSRFFQLYGHSMACKGRIFDAATLAKSCHMPPTQAHRLVRYMNAAHAAAYIGLSSVYPAHGYFDRICVNDFQMLTPDEMKRMDAVDLDAGGSAYRELIVWAMSEIQMAKDKNLIDRELAAMLRDQVLQLQGQAGQLYNAADLPIPFFYVHFICLLTVLYLPLFAITQGINAGTGADAHWVVDIVAGLVVFLQSIFIIGLRILGQKVSDPYGDDLVDFSVMFFIQFTWTQSNRILNATQPILHGDENEDDTEMMELELTKHRVTIGSAWDAAGTEQGLGGTAIGKKHQNPLEKSNEKNKNQMDETGDAEAAASDDIDDTDLDRDLSSSDHSCVLDEQIGFGKQRVT